ncbi:FtsX-like permease family protein [Lacunimicrobium album]
MRVIWKLFLAQAKQQTVRLTLTAIAMVASIGVVVWVVSAYEGLASEFDEQTDEFVGNYDLFIVPRDVTGELPASLVNQVQQLADFEAVNPVSQFRMSFRRVEEAAASPETAGAPGQQRRGLGRMGPTIVGTTSNEPRYELNDGRWLDPTSTNEVVVSSGISEAISLKPGDQIQFRTEAKEVVVMDVVGIVEQVQDVEFAMTRTKGGAPGGVNRGPASLAAYVPMSVVEKLTGKPARINLLELRQAKGKKSALIDNLVASESSSAEILRPEDIKAKVSSGFAAEGARKQAYFVTALSLLASAFIIFTTLSMGVNERSRQLAVLRAVGLRRIDVAQLVLVEAFVLAVFGWLGGLLGGCVLLSILASATPQMFPNGVSLGLMTIVMTGICSLVGAILASVFPIWKATRVSPMEAMAPLSTSRGNPAAYLLIGLFSLLLIAINPLLVFVQGLNESVRFGLILGIGTPATVIGFVLLAPLIVLLVEKVLSPLVAKVLRLQTNLVSTQLSNNMWRSAGIAASLMLGLGLYTATQVWGHSMLGGFLPGQWTPDMIVKFDQGISEVAIEKIHQIEGVHPDICFPIAVEQVKMEGDPLKSRERDTAVRQDNVILIGIDVEAFGVKDAFDLKFVQGDRTEALAKLKEGRHCLVPESLMTIGGLKVGDEIGFLPPKSPDQPVKYRIAGVLAEPGSNWISKTSGLRKNSVRTAGLVFAPRAIVTADFNLSPAEFVWLDSKPGVTPASIQEQMATLLALAKQPARGKGRGPGRRVGTGPESPGATRRSGGPGEEPVKVTAISDVRRSLGQRGGAAVNAMGWLPLITLLVVSLGIVNTIVTSVRARKWEFGILRAVGLRRFTLMRLVISEAILIGFVASVLSLIFGVLTGWTCLGLIRYVSNPWFEGVATPLVIPWTSLAFGYGLTFALCMIAALWPAIATGRSEPLTLLQAGRASF